MDLLEKIGRRLPLIVSKPLGKAVYYLLGSETLTQYLRKKNAALLHNIGEIRKILVISDVNIGDAIVIQSCIEAVRHYFPDSEIDYAYTIVADPVIKRNPHISNFFPIFSSPIRPSKIERDVIKRLCREEAYDIVINFCPFLSIRDLKGAGCTTISSTMLIAEILKAKIKGNEIAHLAYRMNEYINQLFSELLEKTDSNKGRCICSGTKLYLSADVLAARNRYLRSFGISPDDRIVYFNPDASNKYTFLYKETQVFLLTQLLSQDTFDFLLLGPGITFQGIERYLVDNIPTPLQERLIVLDKKLSLDIYASLLDTCDLFITGDTGPMHIAAARKIAVNNTQDFKNRTAIVGIFGSSEPGIYGYDSFEDIYVEASQDAPSKVFEATPDCKDITCSLQRIISKCPGGRCFDGLNIDEIITYIGMYLSSSQQ